MHRKISSLQYLTQDLPDFSHIEQVRMACDAGIEWIQLRMKNKSTDDYMKISAMARKITYDSGVKLIINDHVEIAGEVGADGVHLGREDMYWKAARIILGEDVLIGGSAHSWDELISLRDANVDYAGLGPFRFTSTKINLDEVLGLEGIISIMKLMQQHSFQLPVIAIGGIELNDVNDLIAAGVNGIAVSSAINKAANPRNALINFLESVKNSFSNHEKVNT
ncbi:MAG: thiamine phosphate synthase [Chitinophagaceae bacterium]|nr:thiamine phosphate synthase [Chitinophagaceae bacterium]